ncbi:unnamed protein product [Darwinula stevensoni]|uniref:Uncharacterized protein n=1 Tax=Darwinula stevensoni TaxID=69355 RepID=A0A7R9A0A5_9CRUS|nr:unnamed protein product [Darwinula stevensoni]CAG0885207.1 unnamed protein product [Darwinula stevensoni]
MYETDTTRITINLSKGTLDLGAGGDWRHTLFYNEHEGSQHFQLSRCFTFHPNVSLGVGGEFSGYFLQFRVLPRDAESAAVSWEVYIRSDLGWASIYLRSSYAKVKVKPRRSNHVILSAKEVHQMNTVAHSCEQIFGTRCNVSSPSHSAWRHAFGRGLQRESNLMPTTGMVVRRICTSLPECANPTDIIPMAISCYGYFINGTPSELSLPTSLRSSTVLRPRPARGGNPFRLLSDPDLLRGEHRRGVDRQRGLRFRLSGRGIRGLPRHKSHAMARNAMARKGLFVRISACVGVVLVVLGAVMHRGAIDGFGSYGLAFMTVGGFILLCVCLVWLNKRRNDTERDGTATETTSTCPPATSPVDLPPSYVEAQLPAHGPLNPQALSPSARQGAGIPSSGPAASWTQFDLPPSYEEAVRGAKDDEPPLCSPCSKERF